jgi:hypothetical protein
MTRTVILAAAALLAGTAIASAQTGTATAPVDPNSTTSDTRKIDEAKAPRGGAQGSASPTVTGTTTTGTTSPPTAGGWRTSNGLNNDPDNPSGAPK